MTNEKKIPMTKRRTLSSLLAGDYICDRVVSDTEVHRSRYNTEVEVRQWISDFKQASALFVNSVLVMENNVSKIDLDKMTTLLRSSLAERNKKRKLQAESQRQQKAA